MIENTKENQFLDKIYSLVKDQISKTKGLDVILLLGGTGAGKSTVLNIIAKCKITAKWNDDSGYWEFDANPKIAMIGHTISETLQPNYWEGNGFRIYDCPGFNDTRDTEHEIVKSFFIKEIASNAKSIKIILVGEKESLYSSRCGEFLRTLKQLEDFIPNFNIHSDYSLIVTKSASRFKGNHISTRVKDCIKVNLSQQKIAILYEPTQDGQYAYGSQVNFSNIFSNTPSLSAKCNIPLSAEAKLKLVQLSRSLNKSIQKAIEIYCCSARRFYLQVLVKNAQSPNSEFQRIISLFKEAQQSISQSETTEEFLKNIQRSSRKLSKECGATFKFKTYYDFIEKKIKQMNFLQQRVNDFEICLEDWLQCIDFKCEKFQKSCNNAEIKNVDSFTQFLKDSVSIDITLNIKSQAHSYLNKRQTFNANYSGSTLVSGSLQKTDKCVKNFRIPYMIKAYFQGTVKYNGYAKYSGNKEVSGSVSVQNCSCGNSLVKRCWGCSHHSKNISYQQTIYYEGEKFYQGQMLYKGIEKEEAYVTFTQEKSFFVSKPYNETANYSGTHTACCEDHHQCSCQQLAKIVLSAKEIFEDIQCYMRIAAAQMKEIEMLGNNVDVEDITIIDSAITNVFNFQGLRITNRELTLKEIVNKIHYNLSQTHNFYASYGGSVSLRIEKPYCQNVRFQGTKIDQKNVNHTAYVPYSGEVDYEKSLSYNGSVQCWTCYDNCSWCNRSSYNKSYSGWVIVKGTKTYQGTAKFSDSKVIGTSVPYDEVVSNVGTIEQTKNTAYSGSNLVSCNKNSEIGKGHHNCTSCDTWEKFVNGLKQMLQKKSQIINQIEKNQERLQAVS